MRQMQTWSLVESRWVSGEAPDADGYWFALNRDDRQELDTLARRYRLHPLAVEDCLSPMLHAPKIDDFGDYLFVVLAATASGASGLAIEEFDAFLGDRMLITYVDDPAPFADVFTSIETALAQGRPLRGGMDGILYEVADRVVDSALVQVNELAEELDRLAQRAIEEGGPDGHQLITRVRARAGAMRRMLTGEISVIQRLSRGEFQQVAEPNRIYFRDIYDHLVRIDLSLESVREDAEVALSTSLSVLNNQMNEVMKLLAIVGALALPASVIASIFGTNFDHMPWLQSVWGFWAMIAIMVGVGVAMGAYFWRRGWF